MTPENRDLLKRMREAVADLMKKDKHCAPNVITATIDAFGPDAARLYWQKEAELNAQQQTEVPFCVRFVRFVCLRTRVT